MLGAQAHVYICGSALAKLVQPNHPISGFLTHGWSSPRRCLLARERSSTLSHLSKLSSGCQVSPEEASARIAAVNEPYKQEILDGILARTPDAPITMYHIGGGEHAEHWWDLCGGPHVASTGKINPAAVDLESLAGAAGAVLKSDCSGGDG